MQWQREGHRLIKVQFIRALPGDVLELTVKVDDRGRPPERWVVLEDVKARPRGLGGEYAVGAEMFTECCQHLLVERAAQLRKDGTLPWARPDCKSQLTLRYDDNGKPVGIDAVVLSTQHDEDVSQKEIHAQIMKHVINDVLPAEWLHSDTQYHINPTGQFIIGGPVGDCGLTGRKIIVDTYGGMARHGGGAFSGKDPSKVDRSAAYATRYVAKNIVAAGLADRCEIQVSYAIGVAEPTSISIDTFGTGKISDIHIGQLVREHFDLRPKGLIAMLDLKRPIYRKTAAYGHFGREDADFTWENTDKAAALKAAL